MVILIGKHCYKQAPDMQDNEKGGFFQVIL
jgi:hypothetical protein